MEYALPCVFRKFPAERIDAPFRQADPSPWCRIQECCYAVIGHHSLAVQRNSQCPDIRAIGYVAPVFVRHMDFPVTAGIDTQLCDNCFRFKVNDVFCYVFFPWRIAKSPDLMAVFAGTELFPYFCLWKRGPLMPVLAAGFTPCLHPAVKCVRRAPLLPVLVAGGRERSVWAVIVYDAL